MSLSPESSSCGPSPTEVPPHEHHHGRCPIVDAPDGPPSYVFCPKQEGDDRSPCPALNTLANHGYIPRNGRNISCHDLVQSMQMAYGCSRVLSNFITYGGLVLLGQAPPISLSDLARHNHIEHNASLVHADADETDEEEYAPTEVDEELMEELVKQSHDHKSFSIPDFSKARVRREHWCCHAIDEMHKEIAKGEIAVMMGIFGSPSPSPSSSPLHSDASLLPTLEEDAPLSRSPKGMPVELVSESNSENQSNESSKNSGDGVNGTNSAHSLTHHGSHHKSTFLHKQKRPERYLSVPLEQATVWLREERLPDGWHPQKCGITDLFENITSVRRAMKMFQKELDQQRKMKKKLGKGKGDSGYESEEEEDVLSDGLKAVEEMERETTHDMDHAGDHQGQHWYNSHSHLKLKDVAKEFEGFHIHRKKPVDS